MHTHEKLCRPPFDVPADELPIQAAHRRNDCCWLGQGQWRSSIWLPYWRHLGTRELDNRWVWQHVYMGILRLLIQVYSCHSNRIFCAQLLVLTKAQFVFDGCHVMWA